MKSTGDSTFPATTEADWRARIAEDLHGEPSPATLLWQIEPDVVVDAVATVESAAEFPDSSALAGERDWHFIDQRKLSAEPEKGLIDLRKEIPGNLSCSSQCAAAAAAFAESLVESGDHLTARTLVVTVNHRIVEEIGKLRALRLLLSEVYRVAKKTEDGPQPGSILAPTPSLWTVAGSECTCSDLETHQIRLTYACLASLIGGADAILPTPFDDAEESMRLARNVALVLRHETGMERIQSIADGAYYLNQVSWAIYKSARKRLLEVRKVGGLRAALEEGILVPAPPVEGRI